MLKKHWMKLNLLAPLAFLLWLPTIDVSCPYRPRLSRALAASENLVNTEVAWDAPTINADDLAGYDLALFDKADSTTVVIKKEIINNTQTKRILKTFGVGVSTGDYWIRVRAFDTAGNRGLWSKPLAVSHDGVAPGPPTNVRIRVVIEVTP